MGAVSGMHNPALGWFGFRSPWLKALRREWDAGWAPSTGCLMLADDGMLGAGPLLLARAMRFGTARDVGLGPGQPLRWLWEQHSCQPCRHGWSGRAQPLWGQGSAGGPEPPAPLVPAQPLLQGRVACGPGPLRQSCEQPIWLLLGQTDTGARHPSLGREPTLESVHWSPRSWGPVFLLAWDGRS